MMMRSGFSVLCLVACTGATGARAAPPPAGDNVVVIAVDDVRVPATLPGQCVAKGVISQVVFGSQFHAGQSIAIKVACGHRTPIVDDSPAGPAPQSGAGSIDAMVLAQSKKAVVRLDDTGAVIWQPSAAFPDTLFAQYGRVAGYVVLDGVRLPLSRQAS
jgi:hypothetical protein